MSTLVLASASPRRQELIQTYGIPVRILVSDVDESTPADWSPLQVVEQLALRKARAVLADVRDDEIVVGSDTIVVLNNTILGKPKDEADAIRMLTALQGNMHHVYSGVACIAKATGQEVVTYRKTAITMAPLTVEQVRRYVATGEPMDKAGAYGIQGKAAAFITEMEGDYFSVVGLPVSALAQLLGQLGVESY
jgi:septum formation protein